MIGDTVGAGQSPLHVAIERRSFEHVKMLVQSGADIQAKANGTFFQCNTGLGFYFGEEMRPRTIPKLHVPRGRLKPVLFNRRASFIAGCLHKSA